MGSLAWDRPGRSTGQGVEAPKRSTDTASPSNPVSLCQPKELEASTTSRLPAAVAEELAWLAIAYRLWA